MNDAEYEAASQRILTAVKKWKAVLPMGLWHVDQDVFHGNIPDAAWNVIGETKPHYEYLRARIAWNAEYVHQENLVDDELDKCVIHELLHCLLDRFTHFATSVDEKMPRTDVEQDVTLMTLAVYWAYVAGWNEAKADSAPDIYDLAAKAVAG